MTLIGGLPLVCNGLEIVPPNAQFTNYGAGCPGSTFTVSPCAQLNPTGGTLAGTLAPLEFGILANGGAIDIESFDLFTQSTSGTQTVPAHIYPLLGTTPIASTTLTVGSTPGFYTATSIHGWRSMAPCSSRSTSRRRPWSCHT